MTNKMPYKKTDKKTDKTKNKIISKKLGILENAAKVVLMMTGLILVLNASVLFLIINFNVGLIITLAFGMFLVLYSAFYNQINSLTGKGLLKLCKYAVWLGVAFMSAVILFIATYGQIDTTDYNEDAIIVLGAGIQGETVTLPLMYRLDMCVEYISKNPDAVIVVSGGQGFQEDITEALAMERYLVRKGVPREKILKEEKATSTYENFVFSKEILDEHFKRPYKVVFITNDFHIYRASGIAKVAGLKSNHIHTKLQWYIIPVTYMREFLAVIKFWVLRR
jgi:uncharacterized SAM-binding protein YcdF (DUF218 family)